MVMSFQGQQTASIPKAPQLKVKDFMKRKLVCFNPDQSIEEVMNTLLQKKISGGPVVDKEGRLVGVISEGDCLKQLVRGKYLNMPQLSVTVSECMTSDIQTVDAEIDIFQAAQMFLEKRLRRFPVIEQGKFVGQISQKDILIAVQKLQDTTW